MKRFVIDASVAAKWFLPPARETLVNEALELLRRSTKGEVQFLVPDLFWAEFGNILWKAVRQGRWTREAAESALLVIKTRPLPTAPSRALLEEAFTIATAFDRTIYDCIYVALAVDSEAPLMTADQRLAHALAAHFPIRWLGAM